MQTGILILVALVSVAATLVAVFAGGWIQRRRARESLIDVPVAVDSVKPNPIDMTRCTYLAVESGESSLDERVDLGHPSLRSLMLSADGVIRRPGRGRRFLSREDVEDLFRRIEDDAGLLVDTNDIWLPNSLFKGHPPSPGDVYRVKNDLFAAAVQIRESGQDRGRLTEVCLRLGDPLVFSPEETATFADWHGETMGHLRDQYPKSSEAALSWEDDETNGRKEDLS